MNTIKFSSIYELKKETNNVEVYNVRKIEIDGKEYRYYSNAQMSLYVTKKCNGNCCFCMNKFEKRCCKAKELNDDRYFKALALQQRFSNLFIQKQQLPLHFLVTYKDI